MNAKRWLLPLFVALVVLLLVVRAGSTREYTEFGSAFSSFPMGQPIVLGERARLSGGSGVLWMTRESGIPRPYFLLPNSCTHLPFDLTSPHDDSVARVEVTVCNIGGSLYYRVPIVP